jgi:hypothetical protein
MVLREEHRIVVIASFWDSEDDVARYERNTFPRVRSGLLPFIDGYIRARTFIITSQPLTLSVIRKEKSA